MSSTGTESNQVRSLDALTGLRFFAALAVIIVHMTNLALGKNAGYGIFATNAVSFFFVLSGFILTYVYFPRLDWSGVIRFWIARIARIWPVHLVCVAAAIIVQQFFYPEAVVNVKKLTAHLFLIQSWLPEENLAYWYNGPAWSVSTEMGFYLAFPFLLLLGRKKFWPWLAGAIGLVVTIVGVAQYAALYGTTETSTMIYFSYVNPLFRLIEFVVGMMIGRIYLDRISKVADNTEATPDTGGQTFMIRDTIYELAAVLVLAGSLFCVSKLGPIHGWLEQHQWKVVDSWMTKGAGSILGFALIVWVFSWSRGVLARFVSRPSMIYLGEISFSLYLIQIPVIETIRPLLPVGMLPTSFVVLMGAGICGCLAALLHTIVEMPCRQFLVGLTAARQISSRKQNRPMSGFAKIPDRLWKQGIGVCAVTGLALCSGLLAMGIARCEAKIAQRREVVAAAAADFGFHEDDLRNVTFVDEAILHAAKIEETEDQLKLIMMFEIQPGRQRFRFTHVCDETGKLLFVGPAEAELFEQASPKQFVVDQCVFEKSKLAEAAKIGVGFYAKGFDTATVVGGVQGMSGHRLELIRFGEGKAKLIQ